MVSVVLASRLDREHEKIGNVIPLHGEEGFLFEHLDAVKDLAIEKVYRNVQVTKGDYGPAVKDIYSMNNGLYYEIITSIPTRPTTNIPVDMTTAWGTSAKVKSHNGRSLGVFVEAGMPGRLYGPPKIRLPKDLPSRLAAIPEAFLVASNVSMDQDIAAYALIANDSDELNKYSIESGISFRYGESRGIMEGLGSVAVDRLYGRETVWLEGVDPCVPKELNIPELLRDPKSIGEIFATITSLRKILTEARRLKYIDTLDPSLEY